MDAQLKIIQHFDSNLTQKYQEISVKVEECGPFPVFQRVVIEGYDQSFEKFCFAAIQKTIKVETGGF